MLRKNNSRRFFNRKAIFSLAFVLAGFFLIALFAPGNEACAQTDLGLNEAAEIGLSSTDPRVIIVRVIQVLLGFLGLIAIILVMYAGYVMMTSEGNAEKVEQAKKILKNAIIGLIIILSAFAIVSFILNKLTGSYWGDGDDDGGDDNTPGISALGNGIIKSVYPSPGQTDVVRNTSIIVTFREKMAADTICDSVIDDGSGGKKCAPGAKIIPENVRIFENDRGDSLLAAIGENEGDLILAARAQSNSNITDVNCFSNDNETFVFQPVNYLGSATTSVWHSVKLSTGIKKANSDSAFGLSNGFMWSFEVNTVTDNTPPQVLKDGVFPPPDNEADQKNSAAAAVQAEGSITVLNNPQVYVKAAAKAPAKDPVDGQWPDAELQGSYNCLQDGAIIVHIDDNANLSVNVSGILGVVSGDSADDNKLAIGCGLTLVPKTGNFSAGNQWKIEVTAEKLADTLRVGLTEYVFSSAPGAGKIEVGDDASETAKNIVTALNGNGEVRAGISPLNPAIVVVKARAAGEAGNDIELTGSSKEAFQFTPFKGGKNEEVSTITKGRSDKARNAVIQVNFNEAIDSFTVSGNAEEVKDYIRVINAGAGSLGAGAACAKDADCLSYKCETGQCKNDFLGGKFLISNQYRTVEFISDVECGVNACGEKIYCLPENSNLKVILKAADLAECGGDNCQSKSPFIVCENNICKDQNGKKHPLAKMPLSGVADLASNSLDGNRDNFADGPEAQSGQPPFNENLDITGSVHGDDFTWSFFISDKIDLTPPTISLVRPPHNNNASNFYNPVEIEFSEIMLSSSLATGEKTIINKKNEKIAHKLINIKSFSSELVGYWITNLNIDNQPAAGGNLPAGDGEPDWTKGFIHHSAFADRAKYRTQVGSGVKDIYQNCYLPCSSSSCSGNPSCCGEVPQSSERCE